MEETVIEKLEDYIKFIHDIPSDYILSRGQESEKELLPSALRLDNTNMRLYSKSKAKAFIDDFKINSLMYIDNTTIKNDYEWMVYAQHFGVPTCLLDFTYSHTVSLMFAVENAFTYEDDDDTNSVVWFLNPKKLNLASIKRNEILNISEETNIPETGDYPCVVTARKNNSRMSAQNGLFVYFQQDSIALDKIRIADEVLKKVVIPHKNAKGVLAELYRLGMRFDDIYPELDSVSKDIILKNNVAEYNRMERDNE